MPVRGGRDPLDRRLPGGRRCSGSHKADHVPVRANQQRARVQRAQVYVCDVASLTARHRKLGNATLLSNRDPDLCLNSGVEACLGEVEKARLRLKS